jgi:SAM-dependent methyltransferase
VSPAETIPEILTTRGGRVCPVCGARAREAVDLGDYRLFDCADCGCWSSDAAARGARPRFEPHDYFAHADDDRPRWDDLLRRTGADRALTLRVLDVGCGRGNFLRHLAHRCPGSTRVGIELDADRASAARAADPKAHIETGEAAAVLQGLPGPFDLVTLWDVFEHLVDPRDVLRALADRLAPGGAVFLQTIHERSVVPIVGRVAYSVSGGRLRAPVRRTHEPHHLVFFTRPGLERLAQAAGLRIHSLWFDRLSRARMDCHPALTRATAALLALENALGNGLFVSLLLERPMDGAAG